MYGSNFYAFTANALGSRVMIDSFHASEEEDQKACNHDSGTSKKGSEANSDFGCSAEMTGSNGSG